MNSGRDDSQEENRVRKLGLLILCAVSWLAGYYCGQQPDSPDIFGWMFRRVQRLDASASRDSSDTPDPACSEIRSSFSPNGTSAFPTPAGPERREMPSPADRWQRTLSAGVRPENGPTLPQPGLLTEEGSKWGFKAELRRGSQAPAATSQ